jgi:hypothetical protein
MRHLGIFALLVVLLGGGYLLLAPRTAAVEGRVVLRGLDGHETPGAGAKVAGYPVEAAGEALRQWLREYDELHSRSRLELQAARKNWHELTARRDETARILRVAERANSADLEICRARHREAVADAEDAFRRLEQLSAALDDSVAPARFVANLPPAWSETASDADGVFRAELPGGAEIFLVARLPGKAPGAESVVWLRRGRFDDGEKVQFSNANVLTAEQLAEIARAEKELGGPGTSPAG